jgi:hypothetical protein
MLELSHTVGNSALIEILSLRSGMPETAAPPADFTAETTPAEWNGGAEPQLAEAPVFGAFAPMTAAPLNV